MDFDDIIFNLQGVAAIVGALGQINDFKPDDNAFAHLAVEEMLDKDIEALKAICQK